MSRRLICSSFMCGATRGQPDENWQRAVQDLKDSGLIRAFGISVNRWEPTNVMAALRSGVVDSVQVVYNIFDQAAEDELFPYCQAHGIAIIAPCRSMRAV